MARPPRGVHSIDWRAQQLYERLAQRIQIGQLQLKEAAGVGQRKQTRRQATKGLSSLTGEQLQQVLASVGPDSGLMQGALEELGPYGMLLLPYLQPATDSEGPPDVLGGLF